MKKLLSFEFFKRWRSYRVGFAGAVALQMILLMLIKIFVFFKAPDGPMIGSFLIYCISLLTYLLVFPIEILRFNYEISGSVSVLELSLPQQAWEKILSKLIATVCTFVSSILLCAISFIACIWAMVGYKKFTTGFTISFNEISRNLLSVTGSFLVSVLNITFIVCMIYLCIVVSKSITHKNRFAVPIAIGFCIAYIIAYTLLGLVTAKNPIVTFSIYKNTVSLSEIILQLAFIVLSFFGTSWLVEKKIES